MHRITHRENILVLHYDYSKKTNPDKVLFKYIMYEFLINVIEEDVKHPSVDDLQAHLNEIFDREQD